MKVTVDLDERFLALAWANVTWSGKYPATPEEVVQRLVESEGRNYQTSFPKSAPGTLVAFRETFPGSREDTGWRDASKTLPDDELTVLIACDDASSEPVWFGYHDGKQWYSQELLPVNVTHWQPLPEPPAKEVKP